MGQWFAPFLRGSATVVISLALVVLVRFTWREVTNECLPAMKSARPEFSAMAHMTSDTIRSAVGLRALAKDLEAMDPGSTRVEEVVELRGISQTLLGSLRANAAPVVNKGSEKPEMPVAYFDERAARAAGGAGGGLGAAAVPALCFVVVVMPDDDPAAAFRTVDSMARLLPTHVAHPQYGRFELVVVNGAGTAANPVFEDTWRRLGELSKGLHVRAVKGHRGAAARSAPRGARMLTALQTAVNEGMAVRAHHVMALEPGSYLCPNALTALDYFMAKAFLYADLHGQRTSRSDADLPYAALRVSTHEHGLVLPREQLRPLAQHLASRMKASETPAAARSNGTVSVADVGMDDVSMWVYEWFSGRSATGRRALAGRRPFVYRHNLLQSTRQGCFDVISEGVFLGDMFPLDKCLDDDVAPCSPRPQLHGIPAWSAHVREADFVEAMAHQAERQQILQDFEAKWFAAQASDEDEGGRGGHAAGVVAVKAATNTNCVQACAAYNPDSACVVAAFPELNNCETLLEHFDCRGKCTENQGPDQPAFVSSRSSGLFGTCLVNGGAYPFDCEARHRDTSRLCACREVVKKTAGGQAAAEAPKRAAEQEAKRPAEQDAEQEAKKPAEQEAKRPAEQQTQQPVQQTQKPEQQTQKPEKQTQKPVQQTQKPVQQTQKPVQQTQKPVQQTQKPEQQTQKPPAQP